MDKPALSDIGAIVAFFLIPFTIFGTLAAIFALRNPRTRTFLFAGLGMSITFCLGVIAALGGLYFYQMARTSTPVPPRPGPVVTEASPTPTPQKRRERPQKTSPPEVEQASSAQPTPLYASSLDDPEARAKYCVVAEVVGESRDNLKSVDVTLSEANLSLCNYSSHGARRVMVRIGLMNSLPTRGKKGGGILWSRSLTLAERLHPGESFSIPTPLNISIPKRGSMNMANAKFVVQLSNVPYDSNRENRYYLSDNGETQIAQLGRD